MSNDSTAIDFGINLLEEEIDDVIFRTNEFLTDATFTGGQGPFWWLLFLRCFYCRKQPIIQLLTIYCAVRQILDGTKTGQKHRKIKVRTLATFYPCQDIFVSFAKVHFCPVKNKKNFCILFVANAFLLFVSPKWILQVQKP